MRRWIKRITIGLIVLVLLLFVAVQAILWSDLPRRVVLQMAADQTGLRLEASRLRAGWFGRVTIDDLAVALPGEDQPLLEAPAATIEHTPLLSLVFGRAFAVERVTLDSPTLRAVERPSGRWNIQELMDQLSDEAAEPTDEPAPPTVRLSNATVHVVRPQGEAVLRDVALQLDVDAALWRADVSAPGLLAAEAEIFPRQRWRHEVTFNIEDASTLVALWRTDDQTGEPLPITATGVWAGRVAGDAVVGRLTLEQAAGLGAAANGRLSIRASQQSVAAAPQGLALSLPQAPPMRFDTGRIVWDQPTLAIQRLVGRVDQLGLTVDGQWNTQHQVGELAAAWSGRVEELALTSEGELDLSMKTTPAGRRTAELRSSASVDHPSIDAELELVGSASGTDLTDLRWRARFPQLALRSEQLDLDLAGLDASGRVEQQTVYLENLSHPRGITGQAAINLAQNTWRANLRAAELAVLTGDDAPRLTGRVGAAGDLQRVEVTEAQLRLGERIAADISGVYRLADASIEQLQASGDWSPQPTADLPVRRVAFTAQAQGPVAPLQIEAQGSAQIALTNDQTISPDWSATLSEDELSWQTQIFEALGGRVRVNEASHQWGEALQSQLVAEMQNVDLAQAQRLIEPSQEPQVTGQAGAKLTVRAAGLGESLAVAGPWRVTELAAGPITASTAEGTLDWSGDELALTDLSLRRGESRIAGRATVLLAEPRRLEAALNLTSWPVDLPAEGAHLVLGGRVGLALNLAERSGRGRGEVSVGVVLRDQPVGQLDLSGQLSQSTATFDRIGGQLLGGQVQGSARLMLDTPLDSTVNLQWQGVNLSLIPQLGFEPAEGLVGVAGGTLQIGPAEDARALEPMQITLEIDPQEAAYRSVPIGPMALEAYAGPSRWVLNRSSLQVAEGVLEVWGRVSRLDTEEPFAFVTLDLDEIALNPLAQLRPNQAQPVPGRVSGRLTATGPLEWGAPLSGQGRLELAQTNLGHAPGFNLLYDLMNLGAGESDGRGTVELRLEGTGLTIADMRYFERGTEVIGSGRVADLYAGAESPIRAVIIGRLRPLKGQRLPGLRELDQILTAFQGRGTSVYIGDTLANPDVRVVPLSEAFGIIGEALGQ